MTSNGGKIEFGAKSVLGMADYCHAALSTSVWPAWQLCNIFSVSWTHLSLTSWFGIGCASRCFFGTPKNNECRCSKGYWGNECNNVCHGGLIHPCNNRGLCLKTRGTCSCDLNWRGSNKCSACTEGYSGRDCAISVNASRDASQMHSSTVFSDGFMRTFDGARVRLNGTGEFVAFRSRESQVEAQTRLVRRRRSVVVDAAAVRVGGDRVAFVSKVNGNLSVSINGKEVNENSKVRLKTPGYTYEKKSHDTFGVRGVNGFAFIIHRNQDVIDLELDVPRNFCIGSAGLFGACNNTGDVGSRILSDYNLTSFTTEDLLNYTLQWKVLLNESLIRQALNATALPSFITSAGSCLFIAGNGFVTPELVNVFTSNHASLQVMFKVSNAENAGSLVSLGRNDTVAIIINGTLLVHRGNITIDTGMVIDPGQWMQLTLVYQRNTNVLQVFLCRSSFLIQERVYIVNGEWFEDRGVLGVGLWVASQRTPVPLGLSRFVGWVDDLRIWKLRLDAVTIQAMWSTDVRTTKVNLVAIWKMNEGSGTIARDGAGSNHILLPSEDSKGPAWAAADYKTSSISVEVNETDLTEKRIAAEVRCNGIIFSEVMNKTCLKIIGKGVHFYMTSCLESFSSGKRETAAYDALLAYATECMIAGELSEIPGRELCNEMPRRHFGQWYGSNCTKKCVFGEISGLNITCKCDKGYWGKECDKICPGGVSSPCYGHGICDDMTGMCLCDSNHQGSSTCDKCSAGWFGANCEFVKDRWTSETRPSCTVGDEGQYKAFDLLRFEVARTGRYVLVNREGIKIFVDHMPCFAASFCIKNIIIEDSGGKLEIMASRSNTASLQLMVGNSTISEIQSGGMLFLRTIFTQQVDPVTYHLQIKDMFSLKVGIKQNSLALDLSTRTSICSNATGLCSNCNTTLDTSAARFRPVGEVSISSYALHCLYFDRATVFTNTISVLSSTSVTFDFFVRSCRASDCGGPLVTYASLVSFCISNYVTVRVLIGSVMHDTGIATEPDEWNQIFVSVAKSSLKMDVYVISSKKTVAYKTFKIASYPVVNGGILSVGSWTPSLKRTTLQPKETFKGDIDELRIWTKAFDFANVKANAFSNLNYKASGLLAAWKFNEGLGHVATDVLSGLKLYLPQYPWKGPLWRPSDAPLLPPNNGIGIDDSQVRKNGEVFCTDVLLKGKMGVSCHGINPNAKQYYLRQCVGAIVNQGALTAALQTVLSFSDYCQSVLKLDSWPAQSLCNKFPGTRFPRWIGDECSVPCFYGQKEALDPNKCKCDFGYWGDACNNSCDGGFLHPCYDHGVCDERSGRCVCSSNWQGDANCSSCSPGLTGKDCSIMSSNSKDIKINFAQVGFQGAILMFGKSGIRLHRSGEFVLLYAAKLKFMIQARFVPCFDGSICLVAISIKLVTQTVTIRAPFAPTGKLIVWVNGTVHDVYGKPLLIKDTGVSFSRLSKTTYQVKTGHGEIRLIVAGQYLSVNLNIAREVCDVTVGLLGNCKEPIQKILTSHVTIPRCSKKDFAEEALKFEGKQNNVTLLTESRVEQFIGQYLVEECDSMFIYRYKELIEYRHSNAGFALKLNDTAFSFHNITDISSSEFLTIDFMIRVVQQGTIVSSGYRNVFALSIYETNIYVFANNVRHNTSLHVEPNSWTQIVIQWNRNPRMLYLSVVHMNGTVERSELSMKIELFSSQDIITFGKWQPAMNISNPRPDGVFIGFIDELRIWSRVFSPALIWQALSTRFKVDAGGLIRQYELNEGVGMYIRDKQLGRTETLLEAPWKRPEWKHSSLVLKPQPRFKGAKDVSRDTGKTQNAISTCKKLLLVGSLGRHCGKLDKGLTSVYMKSCLDLLMDSGKRTEALRVVVLYADYCMHALNLTFWPAQELCGQFSMALMPVEMHEKCVSNCVYGKESGNTTCECMHGYWGHNCSHMCPGGSLNPCENHGVCHALNGSCECAVNWNGSSSCGTCKQGWRGKDCSLAVMTYSKISSSYSWSGGTVALLNGAIIEFRYSGAFVLYEEISSRIRIEVLQLPCHMFKVCTKSVAVRLESRILTIAIGLNEDGMRMYIDGAMVLLTRAKTYIHGVKEALIVSREASNEIVIRKGIEFKARVRIFEDELTVSLSSEIKDCRMLKGIMAYCNKNMTNVSSDDISKSLYNETVMDLVKTDNKEWTMLQSRFYAGEYAIHFNGTMAFTSQLCKSIPENTDLTFEVLLKPYNKKGVVFSYAKATVFAFYMATTFKISIARESLETGIPIAVGQWHYAAFVWKANTGLLEVYIGKGKAAIERRTFFLATPPFVSCGSLSLGNWIPSRDMIPPPINDMAVFRMDEIRVWRKAFDPVMIQQNYKMNLLRSYESLTALWKLNRGSGLLIKNEIGHEHIYMSERFAAKPKWVLSDTPLQALVSPLDAYSKMRTKELAESKQYCFGLFYRGALSSTCQALDAVRDLHYLQCIKDVTINSNNRSFAILSVVTFADECQSALGLGQWPARRLCNSFPGLPFLYWIGKNCDVACIFGRADLKNKSLCVCDLGYWGENCTNQCPGGASNPCNGKGKCDVRSGKCDCLENWKSDEMCSNCTTAWSGGNCDVISSAKSFQSCAFMPGGNVISWHGTATKLLNAGEFYLVRNDRLHLNIKALQGYCISGLLLCVKAIAIENNGNSIKVHAPWNNSKIPRIVANGSTVHLSQRSMNILGVSLYRASQDRIEFTLRKSIKLFIRVISTELSISLKSAEELCDGPASICGACGNATAGIKTQTAFGKELAVRVEASNLSFTESITRSSIFKLHFKRVGISTNVLSDVYERKNLTLEIRFVATPTSAASSTLLCYSKEISFAIIIKRTVQIVVLKNIYDTGFVVAANATNQVTLVYEVNRQKVTLYFTNSNGLTWFYSLVLPATVSLFEKFGVLSVGQWISSKETMSFVPADGFEGVIETVRIWQRGYNYLEVKALFNRRINVDDRELISMWDFSEGTGKVVRDVVSKIDLYLPSDVKSPAWIQSSGKGGSSIMVENPEFVSYDLKVGAIKMCHAMVLESDVYNHCKDLGNETIG